MDKTCTSCGIPKGLDQYYKSSNRKSGYQSACKVCMNAANAVSRKKNPDLYKQIHKNQQDKNVEIFYQWKSQQHCLLCSEDRYQCLDLHHLDPEVKDNHIADMVRGWVFKNLQKELDKCVVLCRNCHACYHAGLICILPVYSLLPC